MRHYVILMEEKLFLPDNYISWHYLKNLSGNEIPTYDLPQTPMRLPSVQTELLRLGFIEKAAPTIQEIILNDVAVISLIIWNSAGEYKQIGKFERKV